MVGEQELLSRIQDNTKRGRRDFLFVCIIVLIFGMLNEVVGPLLSPYMLDADPSLLIHNHRWITYDPLGFNPWEGPNPDKESIERELSWIRSAGFDGIITFTSRGTLSMIPELAKERGFAVIMGIWNPKDRHEISIAISKKEFVDAYCVGHNGLDEIYTYSELAQAIRYIRFRTRHPVSTTEELGDYLSNTNLLLIGDWLFPDVHNSIKEYDISTKYRADAQRDAIEIFDIVKRIGEVNKESEKPIMLKMVTYPVNGIDNASMDEQSFFFATLLESRRDTVSKMPKNIAISVHSAFDLPWKRDWPFHSWDKHTGLFDNNGTPRPAVREIVMRLP